MVADEIHVCQEKTNFLAVLIILGYCLKVRDGHILGKERMMRKSRRPIWTAAFLCIMPLTSIAAVQPLYWLEQGSTNAIKRSSLDGTNVQTVVSGQGAIAGFTVDAVAGRIYFTSNDAIQSCLLDGSNLTTLATGIGMPGAQVVQHLGMAVDGVHKELYFTTYIVALDQISLSSSLTRIDLTGTGPVALDSFNDVFLPSHLPFGVAVDPATNRLYWTDSVNQGLHIANLDGSNDHIVTGPKGASATFSPSLKKVFVVGSGGIYRFSSDGSGEQQIISDGDTLPGLAIDDLTSKRVFLADSTINAIYSVPMPTGQIPFQVNPGNYTLIASGLDHVSQVVIIPEPGSLALLAASSLLLVRRRTR